MKYNHNSFLRLGCVPIIIHSPNALSTRLLTFNETGINSYMTKIDYCDMKHGTIYLLHKPMSSSRMVMFFQMDDKEPILESFTIIRVSEATSITKDGKLLKRYNYASNLYPADNIDIYQLSEDEFNRHVVIPAF